MTQSPKSYSVPALDKAILILNTLSRQSLNVSDLHTQLSLPKSTTFVILNSLEQHGIVEKTPGGTYKLGYGVFPWGMSYYRSMDVVSVARPHLEELVADTPYTAHLAKLVDGHPVYIDKVEGNGFVRFATTIGQSLPLHLSGVGKALAVGMTRDEIARSIMPAEPERHHIRAMETMLNDLEFIRKHGFAIEDEEFEEGIRCIGAPIRDFSRKVVAALSVTALSKDLQAVKFHEAGCRVKETAERISAELGYTNRGDDL